MWQSVFKLALNKVQRRLMGMPIVLQVYGYKINQGEFFHQFILRETWTSVSNSRAIQVRRFTETQMWTVEIFQSKYGMQHFEPNSNLSHGCWCVSVVGWPSAHPASVDFPRAKQRATPKKCSKPRKWLMIIPHNLPEPLGSPFFSSVGSRLHRLFALSS